MIGRLVVSKSRSWSLIAASGDVTLQSCWAEVAVTFFFGFTDDFDYLFTPWFSIMFDEFSMNFDDNTQQMFNMFSFFDVAWLRHL